MVVNLNSQRRPRLWQNLGVFLCPPVVLHLRFVTGFVISVCLVEKKSFIVHAAGSNIRDSSANVPRTTSLPGLQTRQRP